MRGMFVEVINKSVRTVIRRLAIFLNDKSKGKITPNLITTLSVAGHLPIAALIMTDKLLEAGLLLIFFGLFDVLDGELARLQKTANPRGMVYDASTDRIKETLLFSAAAYYIGQSVNPEWSFLAALALGGALSVSYAKAKSEVTLTIKKGLRDHHKVNRYFSEGVVSFEIRMTIMVAGLLFDQLLAATALVAVLATYAMFERLIVYMRKI